MSDPTHQNPHPFERIVLEAQEATDAAITDGSDLALMTAREDLDAKHSVYNGYVVAIANALSKSDDGTGEHLPEERRNALILSSNDAATVVDALEDCLAQIAEHLVPNHDSENDPS